MRTRKNIIPENLQTNWTSLKDNNYDLKDKCGIYLIKNKVNNHFYVGSSHLLLKRMQEHRCRFRKLDGINLYIQNAYNKYGEDNFEYAIVEFCSIEEKLNRELYYLTTLEPEYNLTLLVIASKGLARSEQAKLRASITEREMVQNGDIYARKVYIYNIETFTLCGIFNSAKDARKVLKISTGSNLDKPIYKKKYIIRYLEFSSMHDFINTVYRDYKFPIIKEYIIVKNNGIISYYYTNTECARTLGISSSKINSNRNASKENPIQIKDNVILYFSKEYEELAIPTSEIPFIPEFLNIKIKTGSV